MGRTYLTERRGENVVGRAPQADLVHYDPVYHWYEEHAAEVQERVALLSMIPANPKSSSANRHNKVVRVRHAPENPEFRVGVFFLELGSQRASRSEGSDSESDDEQDEGSASRNSKPSTGVCNDGKNCDHDANVRDEDQII
jgi:hypothetical protein